MNTAAICLTSNHLAIGHHADGGWQSIRKLPAPTSLEDLAEVIARQGLPSNSVLLGLPGQVVDGGKLWARATRPFAAEQITNSQIQQLLGDQNIELVASTASAEAGGLINSGTGGLIHVSYEVGFRHWQNGQAVMAQNERREEWFMELRREWIKIDTLEMTCPQWLDYQVLQEWIDPDLQGLSWSELLSSEHPNTDTLCRATKKIIERFKEVTGEQEVWLSGTGGVALGERVEALTAPDDHQPALDGLLYLAGIPNDWS